MAIERIRKRMTEAEREEMRRVSREIQQEIPSIIEKVDAAERSLTIRTRVTEEMHAALKEYCTRTGTQLSDLLRDATLRQIGRKDLVGAMPAPGRPRD